MVGLEDHAPDFTVPGATRKSITRYTLSESLEAGPTILVFYPFDFSPVRVDQLCTFSDVELLTLDGDVSVWGISRDSAYSHQRFVEEYDLLFPLLTDRLGDVADDYDLLLEEFEHHPAIPARAIVSIDTSQTIRYVWTADSQYQSPTWQISKRR